jgi:hypothetical protein
MKKYLAFDSINYEYEEFETIEEAHEWITNVILDPDDGYASEFSGCKIFELKEIVDYDVIDSIDNYKYKNEEDIPDDDDTSEAWPYSDTFDEIWQHKFVPIV